MATRMATMPRSGRRLTSSAATASCRTRPLPLIVRRGAVPPSEHDAVRTFKATFARNGWTNAWIDGIHEFHHYHSNAHEVLGIVSGSAPVRFGGEDGELVGVTAGDVVVIPAGVAHASSKRATTSRWSAPIRTAPTTTRSATIPARSRPRRQRSRKSPAGRRSGGRRRRAAREALDVRARDRPTVESRCCETVPDAHRLLARDLSGAFFQ